MAYRPDHQRAERAPTHRPDTGDRLQPIAAKPSYRNRVQRSRWHPTNPRKPNPLSTGADRITYTPPPSTPSPLPNAR